ncbi:hypothetical protein GCM10023191_087660 [Actinoallomurus oryzae]|uniref:PepSY domain-containing protein n=1 Tax=Actinoallomurus oryzae TaxID=502180 RepID=A0ABP8R2H6_9ACTN
MTWSLRKDAHPFAARARGGVWDGYHRRVEPKLFLSGVVTSDFFHHIGWIHKVLIAVGLVLVVTFVVSRIVLARRGHDREKSRRRHRGRRHGPGEEGAGGPGDERR